MYKRQLFIAGEGEQREILDQLVTNLNATHVIDMPGTVEDVEDLYCNANIFCLPSLWEGFPNALSEALAHGLPCVGFVDCDGVNALIKDGGNGLLAKNNETDEGHIISLMQSLKTLMIDADLRRKMGQNAIKTMEPYHPKAVFDRWEEIIEGIIK